MLNFKIDSKQINKMLDNAVSYSYGFLEGTEINQIVFNEKLGLFIENALKKYIDSRAKIDPKSLHHVYEWEMVGSPNGRLFDFKVVASKKIIRINGKFLKSKTTPPNGNDVFYNKAEIMENGISVTVSPVNSSVLVFDVDDKTVFTTKSVFIQHPGGPEVVNSFEEVFNNFFNTVLTGSLLKASGIFDKLSTPKEFSQWFPEGTKSGGKKTGRKAGRSYMDMPPWMME